MSKIKIDRSAGRPHKNDCHFGLLLKMIFRFFLVATVVTARTIDPTSKKELKLKLDQYQAATGIDDAKKDEIWTKTIKNSKILTFCSRF